MSERDNEEAEPVFQPAEFEIHTDDEVPDFSDKGCAWLWTWCIGPIVKEMIDNFCWMEFLWWGELVNLSISWLYGFFRTTWHWKLLLVIWSPAHKKPNKMAWILLLALIPEISVAKIGRFICVTIAQLWRPTARVFVYYVNHRLYLVYSWYSKSFVLISPDSSPEDGIFFAKWTFCICLIPTVLLSALFMMDMRKMLKNAGQWTWGNTFLFVFGMITSSGYFIKHVMMIVFGIRARRILRDTNDPFDREVQKAWYLHRHAQDQVLNWWPWEGPRFWL